MKRTKDEPTARDLPPAFNEAVNKVLAYQPKNEKRRSRDQRQTAATPAGSGVTARETALRRFDYSDVVSKYLAA